MYKVVSFLLFVYTWKIYHFSRKSAPKVHAKTFYEEEDELITYKFLKQHVCFKFSDTDSVSSRQLQVRDQVHYAVPRWIFEDHPS
jgi:hypothetical protein